VHGCNVQIIPIREMCVFISVHYVSKGRVTDSQTVTFSRFVTEKYESVLFSVELCYVSLLFLYIGVLRLYCLMYIGYVCLCCLKFIGVTCLCCWIILRYVSLLFSVHWCYVSLLFNVFCCCAPLLFSVYWWCVSLLFNVYWCYVFGDIYFLQFPVIISTKVCASTSI
jgi:hypothetical protein